MSGVAAAPAAAASRLGTMDPIAGPLVKVARALGLMEKEEAGGWSSNLDPDPSPSPNPNPTMP